MTTADSIKSIRRALTFDSDLYSYIDRMSEIRKEPFASVCTSMLREIMRDDLLADRK